MEHSPETRIVYLPSPPHKNKNNNAFNLTDDGIPYRAPKKKRVITQTERWNLLQEDNSDGNHDGNHDGNQTHKCNNIETVRRLVDFCITEENVIPEASALTPQETPLLSLFRQQIKQKLQSYKEQDMNKHKYNPELFLSFNDVLRKLKESDYKCFYCGNVVQVFYEWVREPTQWTVERLDNNLGHIRGNIEIACLKCNLRRRTMYHQRYASSRKILDGAFVKVG